MSDTFEVVSKGQSGLVGMLQGRRVRLRPVVNRDLDWIYALAMDPAVSSRWRYRGATISPQQFSQQLWDGILCQFVVEGVETGRIHGLASLYGYNPRSDTCYFAVVGPPDRNTRGRLLEGLIILVEYGFRTWDIRKMYAEVLEFNLPQFRSLERYCELEGRLLAHEYHDGALWDLLTYALYRGLLG